jgi:O-antigen ligase
MTSIDLAEATGAAPAADIALRYRKALAVMAVVLFFTNCIGFVFDAELTSIPPLYPYLALVGLSLPLLLTSHGLGGAPGRRAMLWACAYCAIVVTSVFWSEQSDATLAEVRLRLLGAGFMVTMLIVLADARALSSVRSSIAVCTVVAAIINVYELPHPHVFSAVVGRAAGLYMNPNMSGEALTLGALISVGSLSRRWRAPFLAIVLAGVVLTLSRAAIFCWVLILPLLITRRVVRVRALLTAVCAMALVGAATLFLTAAGQRVLDAFRVGGDVLEVWNRVLSFNAVVAAGDFSTEMRLAAARRAMEMFTTHPLLGYGTGATTTWAFPISTHNIYLRHLAEYGIVGGAIYPSLVGITSHGLWARDRTLAVATGLFLLIWGLFSHNVLDAWYNLLAVSYFLALGDSVADNGEASAL